jgi:hypothetical protein
MSTEIFELPSECKVKMRSTSVAEENIIAEATVPTYEKTLDDVLAACTIEVVSPGPYTSFDGKNWGTRSVGLGDRFVAMVRLSQISRVKGEEFTFYLEHGFCGRFGWKIDLRNEPKLKKPNAETLEALRTGNTFHVEVDGKDVEYRVATGADPARLFELHKKYPNRASSVSLRTRIVKVDGIQDNEIMDWLDGGDGKKYQPMSSVDAEVLRTALNDSDFGMDTEIAAKCPICKRTFLAEGPFDLTMLPPLYKAIQDREMRGLRGMDTSEE